MFRKSGAFLCAFPEWTPPTSASCYEALGCSRPLIFAHAFCATHAHSPSARSIGFCVIWVCISSSSSAKFLTLEIIRGNAYIILIPSVRVHTEFIKDKGEPICRPDPPSRRFPPADLHEGIYQYQVGRISVISTNHGRCYRLPWFAAPQ